ncbi:MAG: NAD-dependent DNA ligase LigA [Candidatus Omnitrophota bacterium]|jgi:DNA ligase (NAD+)
MPDIEKNIDSLREQIRRHDYLYYVLSQPKISDKEYDDLMRKLKGLEDKYPQYKSDDSPTQRVSGGILQGFKTARHRQKMLSLDNTYSFEELYDWDKRVAKGLGKNKKIEFVAELKIDGVSVNLTYMNGRLVSGVTRGDGETGEDVTRNIKTIRAIPLLLRGSNVPELIEIRGEIYMDRVEFAKLNKERETEGEAIFANPRNAASGSLKLLDSSLMSERRLNFFAHSLGEYAGPALKTHWEFFSRLKEWGVRANMYSELCKNLAGAIAYCNKWEKKREGLTYDIDGIVIKVNAISQQKELGFTLKSPRGQVAYKFPAHQATTEVLDIVPQVGRTGIITPVARLKSVVCAGVTIKHATLHNFDEINRLKIRIGDRVLIERAGEVIPKVVKVSEHKGKKEFSVPKNCPVCSGKVVKEKEEDVAYRCINPSCPAQLERELLHFASRAALDIEGMGKAVVEQLVRLKLVRDFADIYKLKSDDLKRLELFKEKKINNLLLGIENSKHRTLSRLIYALGIRHVGEKAAFVLAREFKTLDNLLAAKQDGLDRIYEVGSVMAESITEYFNQGSTRTIIARLKAAGLNFEEDLTPGKATSLAGKRVVFTGELKSLSRLEAERLARSLGANTVSSVSRNTDFVVAGENPGLKYEKAIQSGVKIIDEKAFKEMIK